MGIKYQVNENFFDTWSQEMAYVLGYLYADGSLEDASYLRGKYIRVTSIEKYSVLRIKKWLNSRHTVVMQKPTWKNGKMRYMLRIGSHKLYDALTAHGLYPNKSLTMMFPSVPQKHLQHFVRGYLDGDGCVSFYRAKGKRQKLVTKKLSVIFTSGSRAFLEKLRSVLEKHLDLRQKKIYESQRAFQLRYGTSDSIKLFCFLYKNVRPSSYFVRKTKPFLRYFKLHPLKADEKTKRVLRNLNGHVVK